MKLDMLRTVRLSIIRSLFSVQSTGPGWNSVILVPLESCLQTCMTYTIAECTVCSKNFNLMIQINGSSVNKCGVFCKFRNYSQGRPLWFLAMGAGKKKLDTSLLWYITLLLYRLPLFTLQYFRCSYELKQSYPVLNVCLLLSSRLFYRWRVSAPAMPWQQHKL